MTLFKNTMEVFKLLEKTNCRKCNRPTCLAFAAAVFQGKAMLSDCPRIDQGILDRYADQENTPVLTTDIQYQEQLVRFKEEISAMDLSSRAGILGGKFLNGKLELKILGKAFNVDGKGNISTDIHVNSWVSIPVYHYILYSAGKDPSGRWVPLRELRSGEDWYRFFEHRCEKSLKKIADTYPRFFEDIITIFNGRKVLNHYDADISLVIYPLPKLPILICYQKPEEGLSSSLNLFFDSTAEDNLKIEFIYSVVTGISMMFQKLSVNHGEPPGG